MLPHVHRLDWCKVFHALHGSHRLKLANVLSTWISLQAFDDVSLQKGHQVLASGPWENRKYQRGHRSEGPVFITFCLVLLHALSRCQGR